MFTRSVVPAARSRTNTSTVSLRSPLTRLVSEETNATYRPSALSAGRPKLLSSTPPASPPVPCRSRLSTLTRSVVPVTRSCRNTSEASLVSPGTSVDALDTKATYRPSPLTAAWIESSSPATPAVLTLTRSVTPGG